MKVWEFNRNIQIRFVLQFITTMASMAVTPYLVIYFSNRLGSMVTGFMFIGVILSGIAGSIIGGYLSDRYGRKRIILLSETAIFIGFLVAAYFNSPWANSPYGTFSVFLFIQFGIGFVHPVYQALLIDVSSPDDRKAIYTFSYWSNNLAIAIGGVVGALLFKEHLFLLLLGVVGVTLISIFVTMFFIQETYTPKRIGTRPIAFPAIYSRIWKDKKFLLLALANLFIISLEEQLSNYIGIRLEKQIVGQSIFPYMSFQVDGIKLLSLLRAENTLLIVLLTAVVAGIIKKYKDRTILLSGLFMYSISYSFLSISTVPVLLLIAMFIATIGELMHIPIKQTLLANMVPDHARSSYLAIYGLTGPAAAILAGLFIILGDVLHSGIITSILLGLGMISLGIFSYLLPGGTSKNPDLTSIYSKF